MRASIRKGLLFFALFLTFAALKPREPITEASGVCRLGETLVIAGDENPNGVWLIEDRSQSVRSVTVKNADWDDLEDLSSVDKLRFFAITSHSRTKKGKLKPEREQLLLISKQKSGLAVVKSWSLRDAMISAVEKSLASEVDLSVLKNNVPSEGGLNVEGLAYVQGQLFLGLRSPLTRSGEAILLPITNAKALLNGAKAQFGEAVTLSLEKRGIRGLATQGSRLLVIAGAAGETETAFGLYEWSVGAQKVSVFSLPGFSELLRPEGVFPEKDGSFTFVQDFEAPTEQEPIVKLTPTSSKQRKRG